MKTAPLPAILPELTALRFFAAAIVMAYHYALVWAPDALAATGILGKGGLGVDFFFVLSGFILTHVYLSAREAGQFRYGDFLWARLARIYPLHVVTTLIAIVILSIGYKIGAIADDPVYFAYVAKTLAMVHAWGTVDHFGLNAPSWSISAEWAAYLAFPAFLAIAIAARTRPILFVAAAFAALGAADVFARAAFGKGVTELSFDFGVLRIAPEFLLGCALYMLALKIALPARTASLALGGSIAATLAMMHVRAPELLIVAAMSAIILFAALRARSAPAGGGSRALAHPALVYLGEISYAIYLTHRLVEYALIDIFAPMTGFQVSGLAPMLGCALVSILVAAALHHAIERPVRSWMRALPPSRWLLRPVAARE